MHVAIELTALALVTATVAGLCRRAGLPAPLVLVLVGLAASFVPAVPHVEVEPDVVLVGLLPPLLYAAAIRTSLVDFRANRFAIGMLSVGLVIATTLAVGAVVLLLLPVPPAAAFALGAVVAPPDAVAATSVARRVGMPRRIVTVLEGESLVNDATALVCLRAAVAALAGSVTAWDVAAGFAASVGGGLAVGLAVAWVLGRVRSRVADPVLGTTISLLAPYLAFIPAEEVGASGVLAVVVTGLVLGHRSLQQQSAAARISEATNWRTVQFLLENAVFLLIGLQIRGVLEAAEAGALDAASTAAVCAAVLATTVVVRFAWVMGTGTLARALRERRSGGRPEGAAPARGDDPRSLVVVSWAGMRGVVTLAAVFALPEGTPLREVLVLAALVVVAGTLLGQGATLPRLVRRLRLPGPDPGMDALATASVLQRTHEAGTARLEELLTPGVPPDVVDRLRQRSATRADAVWESVRPGRGGEPPTAAYIRLRLAMLAAERAELLAVRDAGTVPDEVLRRVMGVLDVEESLLDRLASPGGEDGDPGTPDDVLVTSSDDAALCPHLRLAPSAADPRAVDPRAAEGGAEGGAGGLLQAATALRGRSGAAVPTGSGAGTGGSAEDSAVGGAGDGGVSGAVGSAHSAAESAATCEDCTAEGRRDWVHLRRCLACSHVACCDSSPRRHAEAHFHGTRHPVMRSAEPGEAWRWCYLDRQVG